MHQKYFFSTKNVELIKSLSLSLLLVVSCKFSLGQNEEANLRDLTERIAITTNISGYFPSYLLNTVNYNVGGEVYLANRKSISFRIGYLKSYKPTKGGFFSINTIESFGYRSEVELRKYFKHDLIAPLILLFWPHVFQFNSKELPNTGYYFSLHSAYQFTNTKRVEIIDFTNPNEIISNVYDVQRINTH